MKNILVVVDMQNDFIDGALGTAQAAAIVPKVRQRIESFDGTVLFTKDTHGENYMQTQEGRNLPVPHCIKGSEGWNLHPDLEALRKTPVIEKPGFGSPQLAELLVRMNREEAIGSITFVGLCTDICVISNAILAKAALPEVPILVDASCCAGVTPESHSNALEAMKMCQVQILR